MERQAHANSLRGAISLLRSSLDQSQSPIQNALVAVFHQLCTRLHHRFPDLAALHAVPRNPVMWQAANAATIAPKEFALENKILDQKWIIQEGKLARVQIPRSRKLQKNKSNMGALHLPQMPMGASIPTPTNMAAIPPPRYHYRLIPRTPAPPEKFMKTAWLAGKHPSPRMDLRGTSEVVDAWRAGKHPLTSADPNTSEEAALPLGKLYPSSASQATNSPPQMVTTPSLLHRESAVDHCRIQENAVLALTPRRWSDA